MHALAGPARQGHASTRALKSGKRKDWIRGHGQNSLSPIGLYLQKPGVSLICELGGIG